MFSQGIKLTRATICLAFAGVVLAGWEAKADQPVCAERAEDPAKVPASPADVPERPDPGNLSASGSGTGEGDRTGAGGRHEGLGSGAGIGEGFVLGAFEAPVDWKKVPPLRPPARPGMPILFPTGPGYYSLSEQLHGQFVEKAPPRPYGLFPMSPPSFFDLDFRYLEERDVISPGFFDPVKRIHLGDDCLLSVFSQTWVRTMTERNVNFTPRDNDHVLFRTRWAGDFWYRDNIRFFAEYFYAERFNGELDPRPIDINRSELQNLFVEVKAGEFQGRPVYVRVGRQELLLGSQRLISTLDWANTRRKFQGIRGYYLGEDWTVDAFWVQPVPVERNHWDNVDNNINFFGLFAARKPVNNRWWEWYYLYLDDTNPVSVGRDGVVGGQFIHTVGTRVYGSWGNWLYEVEPMLQFGTHANQDLLAASVPVGGGYHFQQYSWKPQVMLYYEWATGDDNPGQGNLYTGFNQLYPFGHYFFGYLDLVARRNIHDVVLQVSFWPENWLTCLVQLHNFWLFNAEDALYNAADQPIRRDATGRAGRYVGTELDLFLVAQVTPYANLSVGYSQMFQGDFIQRTGPNVSPSLLYFIATYRW
jgi:hypothetical protein